jgi:sugar O-acyltransferase (sialic acid O-acetyltransferase NeuD family)
MKLIGIFGAGGYAREVMPIVRQTILIKFGNQASEIVFVLKERDGKSIVNGQRIFTEDEFFSSKAEKYFNVAVGESGLRNKIADLAMGNGCKPFECKASNAIIMDDVSVGDGAVFSPGVVITSNVRIGKFFQANLMSYVAHDCIIGDYVTFAPNVHCNGNVHIEDHAYIGTGAIIKHGTSTNPITIGKGAIVGMGAVVTKDVAAGQVVVGNPARPIQKKSSV